jgi:hypothetical protein
VSFFHQDKQRKYFQCTDAQRCRLIFADPASHLTPEAEKKRYEQHVNAPTDNGYRAFLQKLANPLNGMLRAGSFGLDFGCGPGPTLSLILAELGGHRVALYDPYFYPDSAITNTNNNNTNTEECANTITNKNGTLQLEQKEFADSGIENDKDKIVMAESNKQPHSVLSPHVYDFVTCTEAIEHFARPMNEWTLLLSLLKPESGEEVNGALGGVLGIMTKLASHDEKTFANWWYKRDPTHVSFFSRETFTWLAERDALELTIIGDDVIILRKKTRSDLLRLIKQKMNEI